MKQDEDQDVLRAGQGHARFEDILKLAKQGHIGSEDIVKLFNTTYRTLNGNWRPIIREELRKKTFDRKKGTHIEFWQLQEGTSTDIYLEEVLSTIQTRIPELRPTLMWVPRGRYVMVDGEERVILPPLFTMGVVLKMIKNEMDVMKRNMDVQQKSTAEASRSRIAQINDQEARIESSSKKQKLGIGAKKYCIERLHVYDISFREDFINQCISRGSMPGKPVAMAFDQLMSNEDKARGRGADDDFQVEHFRLSKLLTLIQKSSLGGGLCHFTADGLKRYVSNEEDLHLCLREQKEDKEDLPFVLWNDGDWKSRML